MDTATVAMIVIGACGALLVGMAGLIKSMVLSRLDKIDLKLEGMDGRVNEHSGRIISLEEWRKSEDKIAAFVRGRFPEGA
jgi:hypothetical protein